MFRKLVWDSCHLLSDPSLLTLLLAFEGLYLFLMLFNVSGLLFIPLHPHGVLFGLLFNLLLLPCKLLFLLLLHLLLLVQFKLPVLKFLLLSLKLALFSFNLGFSLHDLSLESLKLLLLLVDFLAKRKLLELSSAIQVLQPLLLGLIVCLELRKLLRLGLVSLELGLALSLLHRCQALCGCLEVHDLGLSGSIELIFHLDDVCLLARTNLLSPVWIASVELLEELLFCLFKLSL